MTRDQERQTVVLADAYRAGLISRRAFISRLLALGLTASAAGAILAACTSAATPAATAAPSAAPTSVPTTGPTAAPATAAPTAAPATAVPEVAKISLWMSPADVGYFTAAAEAFNKERPSIELTVVETDADLAGLQTALAGGGGPDIVPSWGPPMTARFAGADYLLPLDPYSEKYGWKDRFAPWAFSLVQKNGTLYALPDVLDEMIFYYHKGLFDENGWKPPTTIDELTALASQVEAKGIIPFAACNAEYKMANEWHLTVFLNVVPGTAKLKSVLAGEAKWDDPAIVEAIDLLTEYQKKGWLQGGLDRYYTATFAERDTMFATGKSAMMMSGTWEFVGIPPAWKDAGTEFAVAPLPTADGRPVYPIGIGNDYSVNKNSKQPDAAAEFLDWFFSPVGMSYQTSAGLAPAPFTTGLEDLPGLDPRMTELLLKATTAPVEEIGFELWTFCPRETEVYLAEQIEKVWAGKLSTTDYLRGAQGVFDKEIAAGAALPLP